MPLTDTEIRRVKLKEKPFKLSDGGGLYLWVTPSGGKLWRWTYRHEGKQKLMTFGGYPNVSLAHARERCLDQRKVLATGIDPMAQRKAEKKLQRTALGNSFQSVAALWLDHWQHGKSPRHVNSTRRRVAANILPSLGSRPLGEIEAPEVVAMVRLIDGRGTSDIAKRALQTTGQIFRYGIAHGYAKRNPATDVSPRDILKGTHKANYARIEAKDLPDLLREIDLYPGTHTTRLAIRLMALTFVRTGELIGARWKEFDLQSNRWLIPAQRMKMRSPHIVPLSRQALDTLADLHRLSGHSEWVFPGGRSVSPHMSNNTILKGLERLGYKGRMTGHGFRGLASTILHEQGYAHEHIELQLAHAPRNAVSAAYNHAQHLRDRTTMMQDWADFLEQTKRGGTMITFPNVVA